MLFLKKFKISIDFMHNKVYNYIINKTNKSKR
nr:MAG TPA: hypothetical protein [Caudoviricetes sp.]